MNMYQIKIYVQGQLFMIHGETNLQRARDFCERAKYYGERGRRKHPRMNQTVFADYGRYKNDEYLITTAENRYDFEHDELQALKIHEYGFDYVILKNGEEFERGTVEAKPLKYRQFGAVKYAIADPLVKCGKRWY